MTQAIINDPAAQSLVEDVPEGINIDSKFILYLAR